MQIQPDVVGWNSLPSQDVQKESIQTTIDPYWNTSDVFFDMQISKDLLGIASSYPKWNVLPEEECKSLQLSNQTIWTLLNIHSNATHGEPIRCLAHAPQMDLHNMMQAITLGVLFLFALVGNLLTVFSISRKQKSCRQFQSSVYNLIFHLSIADLLVTVTCLFGEAIWSYSVSWLADNFTCKLFKFMQVFSLYLSTFVLVLIGLDRFLAVKYPMKSLGTKRRCNRLIAGVWVLSLLLSIPQFLIFRVGRGPFYEEFYQCVTYGFYTEMWQEQVYNISSLFLMFILPLIVIVWSYVATFITLAKSEKMFRAEVECGNFLPTDANRRRLMQRAKTKSMRISVVIVVAFIICWTPYYFMMIIFMFWNPDEELERNLRSGIFCFGMSNSLINPLIYGAFHLWRPAHQRRPTCSSRSVWHSTKLSVEEPRKKPEIMNYEFRDYNNFSLRHASTRRKLGSSQRTEVHFMTTVQEDECSIVSCQDGDKQNMETNKLRSNKLAAKILRRYKGVFNPQATQIHL